jgi:hypothetical protein
MSLRHFVAAGVLALSVCSFAAESEPAQVRTDANGEPLPDGAVARFGKPRLYHYGLNRLTFAPDGKTLATSSCGHDGPPRVWDLAAGRAPPCPHLADADGGLLAFAPDGTHIVADRRGVRGLDPCTGKVQWNFPQEEEYGANDLLVSADGKTLAVCWGRRVVIRDLGDGPVREPRTLEVDSPWSLLKALAGGAPAARLTQEAKAALERLSTAGGR